MSMLRDIAIQWYRKTFGAPAGTDIRDEGLDTVLDGNTAIALAEAAISSHAVLGGSSPSTTADTAWMEELARGGSNLFGEALSADAAEGPRGMIAAATGLALAGRRATAFLSGQDVAGATDLLISAAGKHAPLVLHVATRATAAHGGASGSGHDAVHLFADAGCFVLFADNVQQAIDFTFVARRVAEEALVPGVVVMDGEQTAQAPQDARLLSPGQVGGYLGATRERIETPTEAQKMLFGDTRRRLPAWHDLDEPMLTGARFDDASFALGAAARRPFFDNFVSESLRNSLAALARRTGREHDAVSRYRCDDAKIVLVAMGSAVEVARCAADRLREQRKLRVGVLGIHALRPFPGAAIAAAVGNAERVFVLERTDTPLAGEPPLTREVRACLHSVGSGRAACRAAVYGVGGLPLRSADIMEMCAGDAREGGEPLYLGLAFDDEDKTHPKREVMLDALRRAYPEAARLGVRTAQADERPSGDALIVEICRLEDGAHLLGDAAGLLHALEEGRVRTRPAADGASGRRSDWLVHGGDSLQDPGDGLVADVMLDVAAQTLTARGADRFFRIPADSAYPAETMLGALFGAFDRAGLVDVKARRAANARRAQLESRRSDDSDARVAAFQSGFEELIEDDAAVGDEDTRRDKRVPPAVRQLGRNDDLVASLPRFWDQAGVLYRDGIQNRLTADPYLATGSMPPLSATFTDMSVTRGKMPAFDATLCTGCSKCWTICPDSAIGVVAAGPAALLDAGIAATGAEPVRQVAGKLASRIIAANKKAENPPATFGPMLEEATGWLMEKAPLPDERKQAIDDGIKRITDAFGHLPVAVTGPFFHDPEARQKDSAELLSIVVNPDACKACGSCVAACEPGALQSRLHDESTLASARSMWETFSATPDTTGESVERAAEHPDIGPTAAMMLSRYCQFAIAGGDAAEAGSGEKIAVRLALAATEYHQQPIAQRFANKLEEAGTDVATLVRNTLSGTLPVEDLDAVSEQLEAVASPRVDLATLAERVVQAEGDHSIETDYVLRLIDLSRRIGAAHHGLVKGEHGLGRARYGLAVAGDSTTAWAAAFPRNPFQVPVLVDMTGDGTQLAAGLVEGHLDETTELVRLLRLAKLECERPDGLDWKRESLAGLRWQDLEDDELELCPPLLLLGSDDMLAGRGLAQLVWLLNSGLPVKVLLMSALDFGLVGAPTNNPRAGTGLLALAQRNAYVAQTSIAEPTHFGTSVAEALSFRGPALIQVYAPSPTRDGFATREVVMQARRAVDARVLPLFRYDPRAEGVFGTRIRLDGNPDDGDEMPTPADWARGQERFASVLDSPALAGLAGRCADSWQVLQELAGVVTPFTDKVEAEIRESVQAEHAAALDAQQKAAAAELAEVRQQTRAEVAAQLRKRLVELASRKKA
jgi:pyruvate-ferredoxin/flavodoxin oxidoreductase